MALRRSAASSTAAPRAGGAYRVDKVRLTHDAKHEQEQAQPQPA
jgi:hypothetical protein